MPGCSIKRIPQQLLGISSLGKFSKFFSEKIPVSRPRNFLFGEPKILPEKKIFLRIL
jgi:hypothetical protein